MHTRATRVEYRVLHSPDATGRLRTRGCSCVSRDSDVPKGRAAHPAKALPRMPQTRRDWSHAPTYVQTGATFRGCDTRGGSLEEDATVGRGRSAWDIRERPNAHPG